MLINDARRIEGVDERFPGIESGLVRFISFENGIADVNPLVTDIGTREIIWRTDQVRHYVLAFMAERTE